MQNFPGKEEFQLKYIYHQNLWKSCSEIHICEMDERERVKDTGVERKMAEQDRETQTDKMFEIVETGRDAPSVTEKQVP